MEERLTGYSGMCIWHTFPQKQTCQFKENNEQFKTLCPVVVHELTYTLDKMIVRKQ